MKCGWLYAALAAMALASCGFAEASGQSAGNDNWPEGIYGNVRLSAESGDLGGFEVRFYEADGRKMAEFVLCEGWCNMSYLAEVSRDGDGFEFEHIEELTSTLGRVTLHQVRYRLTPMGEGLALESWYDGAKLPWDDGDPIPRIDQPFGLNVANEVP